MAASVLATICAERLTKLVVRYTRAPSQPMVLSPLPKSDATGAYLKPLTTTGKGGPAVAAPVAKSHHVSKWQQKIGHQFQAASVPVKDQLPNSQCSNYLPLHSGHTMSFSRNKGIFPSKAGGLKQWRHPGTGPYRPPFVSLFQDGSGSSVPIKSFSQDLKTSLDRQKLYRDCY